MILVMGKHPTYWERQPTLFEVGDWDAVGTGQDAHGPWRVLSHRLTGEVRAQRQVWGQWLDEGGMR